MKEKVVYSTMALVLVLGMALTLTLVAPVAAATVTFTGNVTVDFTGTGILIIPDPGGVGDVGLPTSPAPPGGTISGWDMEDLRLTYDEGTDTLYVGINTVGIAGDADGDGDPSGTSSWLSTNGGTDTANLSGTETISVYFDLDKDGHFDVIGGVPADEDITGFTVANFSGVPQSPGFAFGTDLPGHTGSHPTTAPNATNPDFEFSITGWSTLPGDLGLTDTSVGGFIVWAFLGSLEDDGVGEDYIRYEQNPHTILTITSSAATVSAGDTVDLTVIEANVGNVSLTDPYVELLQGATHLDPLGAPDSGDTADIGVLNVGENWTWNITSNAINALTLFTASGNGTAPGDFPVNLLTDPLEQDDVEVDAINPAICIEKTVDCNNDTIFLDVDMGYAGDTAHWKVVVTNCGDSDLFNVTVTDTNSHDFGPAFNLSFGSGPVEFNYDTVVSVNTTNNATVTATDALGGTVSDWDIATNNVISPAICVEKTVDCNDDAEFLDVDMGYAGDTGHWKVVVTNCGDSDLTNVTVTDTNGHPFGAPFSLPYGAAPVEFNYDTVVSVNTTNNVTVTATDALGGAVSDWDIATNNVIAPNTTTTIAASAATVVYGGSVLLSVNETNTGDNPLTNPYVEVRKGATLIATLTKGSGSYAGGDTSNPNVLDPGETWMWTNIPSGSITGTTVFEAKGFGTDSLSNEVSFDAGYPSERATVTVGTIQPDTETTISANTTLVDIGGCVLLTVTEENTGGVNLTNPYVEVWVGLTCVSNLTWASPHSDDIIDPNVLNVGETWSWDIAACGISTPTTFVALGFGTDPLGNEISYATNHYDERDTVTVYVRGEACLQICKFQDANVNGIWDPGEPWLSDWKFHVTGPAGYDTWVTTGPDGCVELDNLVVGTYHVTEELQAGWYNTRPGGDPPYEQQVVVAAGASCARVEFGNREEILNIPPMVPTLNTWGIIAMIILFTGLLVWTVRRKRLSSRMS
jgi:hypothetical protein